MPKTVDSTRFVSGITKRLVRTWIKMEEPSDIPWTPLVKPLSDCTVAMISTGGLALAGDAPFDQEGERRNPWWGDPSFRYLPKDARSPDVKLYHLHVDPTIVEEDLNSLLPLQRLLELEALGKIGRSAPSHYSIMGYILEPEELLKESVPAIIGHMRDEGVEAVVLVPA